MRSEVEIHDHSIGPTIQLFPQFLAILTYLHLKVQYHGAKRSSSISPRLEGPSKEKGRVEMPTREASRVEMLLKDLERDVERRERFLRFSLKMTLDQKCTGIL